MSELELRMCWTTLAIVYTLYMNIIVQDLIVSIAKRRRHIVLVMSAGEVVQKGE